MPFFSALEVKYWTDGMAHRVKSLLPKKMTEFYPNGGKKRLLQSLAPA